MGLDNGREIVARRWRSSLVLVVEVVLEVKETIGGFGVERRRVDVPAPHRVHPIPSVVRESKRRRRRGSGRLVDRTAPNRKRLPREGIQYNVGTYYMSKKVK